YFEYLIGKSPFTVSQSPATQQYLQGRNNGFTHLHGHSLKTDRCHIMLATCIHTTRYLDVQVLVKQVLWVLVEYHFFQDLCGAGTAGDTQVASIRTGTCRDISQGIVTISHHI